MNKNILTILFSICVLSFSILQAQSGSALSFNGSNQYVSIPYNSVLDIPNGGALTIECWVYPVSGANIITRDNYGYGLWYDGGNTKKLYYWDQGGMGSTISSTGSLTLNKWQHIAVTVKDVGSSLSINFYINGVADAGNPKTSTQTQINNGGGTLDIGIQARSSCGCNFYSGMIDDLRIWNVERTAAEIRNNYLTEVSASSSGLIAYYKFNNGSGSTLTDATSNGLNGTIYNSASWAASGANIAVSGAGNALIFDGSNDYVTVSSASQIDFGSATDFTIEAWLKDSSPYGVVGGIAAKGSASGTWTGYQLITYQNVLCGEIADGSASYIGWNQGIKGTTNLADGNWHHVAMVVKRSTTNVKLYVDGNLEANYTNALLGNNISNGLPLLIGTHRQANSFTTGLIDEIRIWNVARTQTELQNNKNIEIDPTTSGLVAYYRFDEGISSGTNTGVTTLLDLTSYKNNGTLTNFALSGSTSNWVSANNAALPVELTSFTATSNDGNVSLNWQTATEVNNYGFDIECKSENSNWTKIAFVQGHGNSNSPKNYSFEDASPHSGLIQYRLKQIDFDGKYEYSSVIEVNVDAPVSFALNQNHPNPFNPETIISFQLPASGQVSLKVFDILGKEVAELVNEQKNAGNYEVKFNGKNLAGGIYFYRLRSGNFVQTKKFVLMK